MIFDFARSGALVCCNVPILGKYRLALRAPLYMNALTDFVCPLMRFN